MASDLYWKPVGRGAVLPRDLKRAFHEAGFEFDAPLAITWADYCGTADGEWDYRQPLGSEREVRVFLGSPAAFLRILVRNGVPGAAELRDAAEQHGAVLIEEVF